MLALVRCIRPSPGPPPLQTFGLHAVPSTVDVGVVTSPRSWGQHPVRLFNADPRPATITAVLATPVRSADGAAGPPLAVAQHVAGSVTVPPGGYQTVLVLGAPPDASLPPGDFSATILIGTDDPDQPPVRVTWRALVAYGSLLVPDEAVTFHVARVAAEGGVRRSIRLTNNFPGPLTLLGATSSSDAIAVEGVGSSQVCGAAMALRQPRTPASPLPLRRQHFMTPASVQVATPWGEALPVITVLVRPSAALTLPAPLGTHQLLVATDVTSVRIPIRLAFDPLSLVCVGSPSDLEEVSPNEWRTHGGAHVGLVAPGAPIDHWCLLTNASEEPLVLPSLRECTRGSTDALRTVCWLPVACPCVRAAPLAPSRRRRAQHARGARLSARPHPRRRPAQRRLWERGRPGPEGPCLPGSLRLGPRPHRAAPGTGAGEADRHRACRRTAGRWGGCAGGLGVPTHVGGVPGATGDQPGQRRGARGPRGACVRGPHGQQRPLCRRGAAGGPGQLPDRRARRGRRQRCRLAGGAGAAPRGDLDRRGPWGVAGLVRRVGL